MIERYTIPVITAADGSFTGYATPGPANGKVVSVGYTPDGTNPLSGTTTIALTGEASGVTIASHGTLGTTAFQRTYQQAIYQTDGTAALYAAAGKPLLSDIYLSGERIKLVISGGGNALKGTFDIYVDRDV